MLGLPADGIYLFLGVALVSITLTGTALQLESTTPTGAEPTADTIDAVAADAAPAVGVHPVTATSVTVAPTAVTVTADQVTQTAPLTHGPVVPVAPDTQLGAVLAGRPPQQVYATQSDFAAAVAPENRSPQTYTQPGRIRIRTITWGDIDVTLVGQ